jgi:hypothetical protein
MDESLGKNTHTTLQEYKAFLALSGCPIGSYIVRTCHVVSFLVENERLKSKGRK